MSSCRLVRVFCKKEANKKVKALREDLELKEKDIEEKDTKLNTLLQDPFGVIKLLATQYFNLRRSIEEPSNVRTRQLTEEQAAAAKKAVAAVAKAEVNEIESFLLEEYGVDISKCYENNLDISDIENKLDIKYQLEKFITCCNANFVALLDAEETEFTTEINEDTITFTSNGATDTLTQKMTLNYFNAPYKKMIINGFINIGENAFTRWSDYLEEVVIDDSVVSIGNEAFYKCDTLTELDIGNSVKTIGNYAFAYCKLEEVDIPDSVEAIDNYAFKNCDVLKKVVIGNSVEAIGYYAFSDCKKLEEVDIGKSVKTIGDRAFFYCKLNKVNIPDSVKNIDDYAFYKCDILSEVIISDETAKILNPEWSSPSPEDEPVSSFYGSSKPVDFILPEV